MKKIAVMVLCFLFLCGCSGADSKIDSAISLRQRLLSSQECSFTCAITADYLDKIYTFSMQCTFDPQGNMTFSVIEPESISGITGSIGDDGGKLTFDDQALAFELLADGYVSPVSAPWLFMKTLRGGYINACGRDGDGYRITLDDSYEEKPLQLDIWTNADNIPVRCEILWQGRRILSLEVSNFSCV